MAWADHARRIRRAILRRLPAIRLAARVDERDVETTVDSDIARYYAQHYWRGERTEPQLDTLIEEAERLPETTLPTREQLLELSRRLSVDFAALFLFRRIHAIPENGRLRERFRQETAAILTGGAGGGMASYAGYLTLFVPGFLYRYDPESGADFARARGILASQGLPHHLVEIHELGPVSRNAQIIADAVREHTRAGKQILLVGASSAGPAILEALGNNLRAAELAAVLAWVNIGGVLRGAKVADRGLRRPQRWFYHALFRLKGWRLDAVEGYTRRASAERWQRVRLPPHLFVLNFVGIPLSGQVTDRGWRGYLSLLDEGPNDGLTPILDAIAPNSVTIAELGLDHYFLDPAIDAKTVALARTVFTYLQQR